MKKIFSLAAALALIFSLALFLPGCGASKSGNVLSEGSGLYDQLMEIGGIQEITFQDGLVEIKGPLVTVGSQTIREYILALGEDFISISGSRYATDELGVFGETPLETGSVTQSKKGSWKLSEKAKTILLDRWKMLVNNDPGVLSFDDEIVNMVPARLTEVVRSHGYYFHSLRNPAFWEYPRNYYILLIKKGADSLFVMVGEGEDPNVLSWNLNGEVGDGAFSDGLADGFTAKPFSLNISGAHIDEIDRILGEN